jgi:hypothetical protein
VKTVLIVADDLGFAFWLGQALDRVGCQTWPARSVAAAEALVAELKLTVDMLVITASLRQAPGFATRLSRATEDFKVIAVTDERSEPLEPFPGASVVHQKPRIIDTAARLEWVRLVLRLLGASECPPGGGPASSPGSGST